jgi:hypothetical protein
MTPALEVASFRLLGRTLRTSSCQARYADD